MIDFKKLLESFRCAEYGLRVAVQNEQNLRIEIAFALIAISCGFYFDIRILEWLWIIQACFAVICAELVNTAIERLTDIQSNKKKMNLAKQAKDVSAGAVLLAVFYAWVVGLIIFLPKIL